MLLVHGTCVEIEGIGVLIVGPPGSGKSDLALRLLDAGAGLVADDYLWLDAVDGSLTAKTPEQIAGLLEVRGLGIVKLPYRETCNIGLCVEIVDAGAVPRLPEAGHTATFEGVAVHGVTLAPFEASAPAKVKLAARAVRNGIILTE
jgi:HPr kinase/phosphorylase